MEIKVYEILGKTSHPIDENKTISAGRLKQISLTHLLSNDEKKIYKIKKINIFIIYKR